MGHSSYDPFEQGLAWNAGRKLGAKRPLKPKEIWELRFISVEFWSWTHPDGDVGG